jgi:hypothetical protein
VVFKQVAILAELLISIDQLKRVTARFEQGRTMFEGSAGHTYPPEPTYANIHEFIANWEDSWPIQESFFPLDPSTVAQVISSGTTVMVSNGSYKPLLSTKIGASA